MKWIAVVALICCVANGCRDGGGVSFCGAVTAACHGESTQTCDDVLSADNLNYPDCKDARDDFLDCVASKEMTCPSSQTIFAGAGDANGIPFELGGYTMYTDDPCADLGDEWYACEHPVAVTCIENAVSCRCSTSSLTPGPGETLVPSCDEGEWQCCHNDSSYPAGRYSSSCDCVTYLCLQSEISDDCECMFRTSPLAAGDVIITACASSLTSVSGETESLCCDVPQNPVDSTLCGCTSYYSTCQDWIGGAQTDACSATAMRTCNIADQEPTDSCEGLRWR
jgi:hypothetical protein